MRAGESIIRTLTHPKVWGVASIATLTLIVRLTLTLNPTLGYRVNPNRESKDEFSGYRVKGNPNPNPNPKTDGFRTLERG